MLRGRLMTRLLSFLGVFRNPPEVAASCGGNAVATAPDSQNGAERDLFAISHCVDIHNGKIHDAELAGDIPRLRHELFQLQFYLDEAMHG